MPELEIIKDYANPDSFANKIAPFRGGGSYHKVDEPPEKFIEISTLIPANDEYHTLDIPNLQRCVGVLLIFAPYSSTLDQCVYMLGSHVTPMRKNLRQIQEIFINNFLKLKGTHYVSHVIMAGGKINNSTNCIHFANSTNLYFKQFLYLPFLKYTKFVQFLPQVNTTKTHMWATGNRVIVMHELDDGNVAYNEHRY